VTTRRLLLLAVVGTLLPLTSAAAPLDVRRYMLPNGVRLLVREDATAGVVAVSLQVRAGSAFETSDTSGLTNFLHRVMLRGTLRRSATQLAEAAERLGGSVDASGEVDYAEVRGTALARHWEPLLGLVAEVVLSPTLLSEEIDKERRLVLGQVQTRADTPFPLSLDTLLRALYGSHPYALPSLGRRDTLMGFHREALVAQHRTIYRPDRLVLAVSGQVEGERVRLAAGRLLGVLPPASGPPAPEPGPATAPKGTRVLVEKRTQQAHVLMGFLGPSLAQADYPIVKVLSAVLGGGMAGRLFVELRDRQGLAYSLGMINPTRQGPSFMVAYLGTARENLAAAEAGMRRELERVGAEGVPPAELARAKAYVLGTLAMDRRTNARHAWYLAYFELVGAGWDFPERHAQALEAVTAADVQAAARRYLTWPTIVVLQPPG
jgi:predicted Zn-dependent peptidase